MTMRKEEIIQVQDTPGEVPLMNRLNLLETVETDDTASPRGGQVCQSKIGVEAELKRQTSCRAVQSQPRCHEPGYRCLPLSFIQPSGLLRHFGGQLRVNHTSQELPDNPVFSVKGVDQCDSKARPLSTQTKCDETHKVFRPEPSFTKNLMEIGTRRIFSEEHDIFRQSMRRFFEAEVLPYHTHVCSAYLQVFITNGWMCDVVIVVAVTDHKAHSKAHGLSLFLVDNGMNGFIKGKKLEKIGLKAQDTAELFFEDVCLPPDALLGEVNKGFYYLMTELPQERLLIADMALANCEFMFEETRKYVRQRKVFGKTVADLQTVQHKLAEIKTQTCVGRAFVDSCLQLHKERRLDSATASMAKYWASEQQTNVANQCVQLHGGWGYMWEYPIAKSFVDSRVQLIYGGTNEVMKELIARGITSD
ncbi:long-chain specific acyl-CoA dehydrogenase, mitochondrial [Stegostoma tigrinum]|uniref:long-chain specific acyl-CoA dehydrogenase, mitochondrial n=1 Tax=Stegostoma tigrinum TaxID=3053191 RepID=UPI00287007E2|nr:long-chain specific acyl-CoA dehydrogenase, mitochondrial [Stegostoma tigrinum]